LVQGTLQLVVAAVVLNERKVDLVLDKLEGAVHLVLAPSGHPASHSCAVVELVAELVSAGWQARGVHVRLVQVDVPVRVKERNVVAQPSCVELRVLEQPDHGVLLVLDSLWGVEAACVVLANTDFQELILLDVLELVFTSFFGASVESELNLSWAVALAASAKTRKAFILQSLSNCW